MKTVINEDGSFTISGEYFRFSNVYPGINDASVHSVNTVTGTNHISYDLGYGTLTLRFETWENRVAIHTGFETHNLQSDQISLIHDIEPLVCSDVSSACYVFSQGFGMEGPSGVEPFENCSMKSYGLIALTNTAPTHKLNMRGNNQGNSADQHTAVLYASDYTHVTTSFAVTSSKSLHASKTTQLTAGFNIEGITSELFHLPDIIIEESGALNAALQDVAMIIAKRMNARPLTEHKQPAAYHWCSWYYLYQNISETLLDEYVEKLGTCENNDFRYIQIDAGYCHDLGDWLIPHHSFPHGLERMAQTIRGAGYGAGIWVAPFIVADHSILFREHPEWLLRTRNGELVTQIRSYSEPKVWGNIDSNYYVLDTSNPEALDYIAHVFATLRSYGYTLFKTDFMLWNMHDSSEVSRYDSSLTSVEILRNTLQTIREAIGDDSYWLGCIAPFFPFIGYADGMRIAGDVGAQWANDFGPVNMIHELQADSYFSNIFWQNDPDAILLRDFDTLLETSEVKSLALLQALSGGVVTTSDPLHLLSEQSNELLSFIHPPMTDGITMQAFLDARFPYSYDGAEIVITHQLESGGLFFVMNTTESERTVAYDMNELFGDCTHHAWLYSSQDSKMERLDKPIISFACTLAPHESALLFISETPLTHQPRNLWSW